MRDTCIKPPRRIDPLDAAIDSLVRSMWWESVGLYLLGVLTGAAAAAALM